MTLIINRVFEILAFDFNPVIVGIGDIIINPPNEGLGTRCEYIYALREMPDEILELKIDEVIYFNMNKDGDEKALLRRIK